MPLTDPHSWTNSVLDSIKAPRTKLNTTALILWQRSEGMPDSAHNPLATTEKGFGGYTVNTDGVFAYPSWAAGVDATVATLIGGGYGAVVQAFQAGNSLERIWSAINSSQWCANCQNGQYPVALYDHIRAGGGTLSGGGISGSGTSSPPPGSPGGLPASSYASAHLIDDAAQSMGWYGSRAKTHADELLNVVQRCSYCTEQGPR